MKTLVQEKEQAILLRKKGMSYKEILKIVPVSKSSLSYWLADLPLTKAEKHLLKDRIDKNIAIGKIRAGTALRALREAREKVLLAEARETFERFALDPFFHVGISLYWAEGTKRNSAFGFTNSDWKMMALMITWIEKYFEVNRRELRARLYTHKPFAHEHSEEFWAEKLSIPFSNFRKTIYKPTGRLVKKRPEYRGCLRIELRVAFLRKMQFFENMLFEFHKQ